MEDAVPGATTVPGTKNVVFLVLDSLRTDRISPYDPDVDFTDTFDALADDAIRFENAVAQAPWTLPSHASMFTGQYPWEHGTTHARSYFDESQETFVGEFREAGYETAAITPNVWITPHKGMTGDFDHVENFLGAADNPVSVRVSRLATKLYENLGDAPRRLLGRQLDRVFRLFGVDDSCKSEETVAAVESYLGDRDPRENFFLYVNLMEPHEPYHPPKRYADNHGVTDPDAIPHRQKDLFTMDDISFEELRKIYDASVDYTDDLVGRIVDSLDANGLSEDTVVVLLSDHGQALGEDGGAFGHQFTVIEPVVNSVLMVAHPDLDGRTESRPIELRKLHDLVPYYAGLQPRPDDVFEEPLLGGCEFPENFTGFIPRDRWDEFYRKYRYARSDGRRVVKTILEDGTATYEAFDLETGDEIPVPEDLRAAVDGAGDVADSGRQDNGVAAPDDRAVDDEVEQRLEELGYR
jgi:arylsulfatase A-like enzyme